MTTPATVERKGPEPHPAGPGDESRPGLSARVSGRATGRPPARLVVLALLVSLLALVPLIFVVVQAVQTGWGDAVHLVFRHRVGKLLWNTVRLVVVSTLLCAVLGVGAAFLVERTDLPGRRLLTPLLAAPLAVPAFVSSYGWVSLTSRVQGFAGAVVIVSLAYYPLVYLPVLAALRGLDPALGETGRSLGLGPARVFTRVTLPQLRPALGGGMLIVALHLLAEFGAFALLRFDTFTTAIYVQYQSTFNGPAANMLASVLVLVCLVLLVGEERVRGARRYARLGPGAARVPKRVALGRAKPLAFAAVLALLAVALGVPIGSIVHWLVTGASRSFPVHALVSAAGTSIGLGLAAAAVTTLLALPAAVLAERHRGAIATVLERSTYVAHSLPGIVVALSLVFAAIHVVRPLYQTNILLVAGYAILFLPLAMVGVRAALAQASPALTEAARALGDPPLRAFRRVTLPLIAPGLGAAAALVFLMVSTELTATLLLAPIGTKTLATQVWSATTTLSYGQAAPFAACLIVLSAPMVYLLTRMTGRAELV